MLKTRAAAALGVALAAGGAMGQVTLVSQNRTFSGLAHISSILFQPMNVSDTFSNGTTDPGPFSYSDSADAISTPVTVTTAVAHTSNISTSGISFASTLTASSTRLPSGTNVDWSGVHSLSVVFHVDTPTDYTFVANVGGNALQGSTDLVFQRVGGGGLFTYLTSSFGAHSTNQSGTLQPGDYQLAVSSIQFTFGVNNAQQGGPYTSSFDGTLTFVPGPGAAGVMGMAGVLGLARRRR